MMYRIAFLVFSALFFLLLTNASLHSQSLNGVDPSAINVDELSDQQITKYAERAREKGFSVDQVEQLAKARGVSQADIDKIKLRLLNASSQGNLSSTSSNEYISSGELKNALGPGNALGKTPGNGAGSNVKARSFGQDLFQSDNLTFSPNLNVPTPEDYVLGPGDELVIDLWGATELSSTLVVSNEGMIKPNNVGPIYVNGLSIEAAKHKIINKLSSIYRGLRASNGAKPSTFYQISLSKIKSINVTIVGEVNNPGDYILNSLSTVFTALYASGGPSPEGTFREIELIRGNQVISKVDLYDFLIEGIKKGDQRLKNGDVVVVKSYLKRVLITGEVKRRGYFELKNGDTFEDLLEYAGGYTFTADRSHLIAKRFQNGSTSLIELDNGQLRSFIPQDGDQIEVGGLTSEFSFNNRVSIAGAVVRPGEYELKGEMMLKNLILSKGLGLRSDAFTKRAFLYRKRENLSTEVVSIDLEKLLSNKTADISLKKEDRLFVYSIYEIKEQSEVNILGQVIKPGTYPFLLDMTVQELVLMAGGLNEGASNVNIEISRRNVNGEIEKFSEVLITDISKDLDIANDEKSIKLNPFDIVYIRKKTGYAPQQQVGIEGEILRPGQYALKNKNERISDIVKRSGGLSPYAYAEGAILIRNANISRDNQGAAFKRQIIRDINKSDSLLVNTGSSNTEIVVIELLKALSSPGTKHDIILQPGDVLSIPTKSNTIRVSGEVNTAMNLRYDHSKRFRGYVRQTGGFKSSAKKGRSFVQYSNGSNKGVKNFLLFRKYPKIEPGSTILIAKKPPKRPINIQNIVGTLASIATLALIVDRL